jgi:hypothetical protein
METVYEHKVVRYDDIDILVLYIHCNVDTDVCDR